MVSFIFVLVWHRTFMLRSQDDASGLARPRSKSFAIASEQSEKKTNEDGGRDGGRIRRGGGEQRQAVCARQADHPARDSRENPRTGQFHHSHAGAQASSGGGHAQQFPGLPESEERRSRQGAGRPRVPSLFRGSR
eukprot:3057166-Pyramimonas_sp.AAC.1